MLAQKVSCYMTVLVFFFFLFVSTRVWTHGLELVKQALPLEPFCFAVFQIGSYAFGPGSS